MLIITNETSTINEQDEPTTSTSTSVDHETKNQKILRPKNNKRKLDKEDDMLNKFNILSASAAATTGEDEYSSYGNYIENKLRQYSAETRSAVQYAINDILLQADKSMYETNIVQNQNIYHSYPYLPQKFSYSVFTPLSSPSSTYSDINSDVALINNCSINSHNSVPTKNIYIELPESTSIPPINFSSTHQNNLIPN